MRFLVSLQRPNKTNFIWHFKNQLNRFMPKIQYSALNTDILNDNNNLEQQQALNKYDIEMLQSIIYSSSSSINPCTQDELSDINYLETGYAFCQKTCQSGKYVLDSGVAQINNKISICCNMLYDSKTKIFKQKITKFAIILSSDRGEKQAGQILFDVAQYVNQRQLNKKDYQLKLDKCPDKNAKLFLTLSGVLTQQISKDAISQSSYSQSLMKSQNSQSGFMMPGITNSMIVPSNKQQKSDQKTKNQQPTKEISKNNSTADNQDKLQKVEQQNKKLKQQLKKIQKLKKQNQDLRKKIKSEDFKKVTQIKQKMEKLKGQIEKMKAQVKSNKNIGNQTQDIQDDILSCKIKIMKALNFCAQYGGSMLLDEVQYYCGMLEKE